jgi:hypothetical protein
VSCYEVAKDFAGPVATIVIALAAGYITWSYNKKQVMIAQDKLKFDLFEKRYEFFEASKQLLQVLFNQIGKESHLDVDGILKLRMKLDEGRFFFGPEVQTFFKELDEFANELIDELLAYGETQREHKSLRESTAKVGKLTNRLANYRRSLPQVFEKDLGFRQLT